MEQRSRHTSPETGNIVAVGLLTDRDLSVLGQGFQRAYKLEQDHDFHDLLAAIDDAERTLRGVR